MILCSFFRSSNDGGLLLWCLIGVAAGICFFIYGFRLLLRRRLILDTPFSKIRSASMGMVEVSGLAVGPYTMVAPVTARPCYYYRTYVWEWKQSGKNKEWVKVAAESMHVPFFLDDNTGRVLIDPRGADLDLHRDFQQEFCDSFFTTKDPAPDNVSSFLARHGISTSNKIKVEEYCIKPKNALFVLGTLSENPGLEVAPNPMPDPDGASLISSHGVTVSWSTSFRSTGTLDAGSFIQRLVAANAPPQKVIHLSIQATANPSNPAEQEKIAAALLKAGISNPAAWSAAGIGNPALQVNEDPSFTNQPVLSTATPTTATNANGFDHHPPVVLMKGTNNKTFLISWRSQQDVARSLGWKCTLMIWGGPILALLSLYVLLNITNLL
ncbi:MAG: E3 ubiquitin ligase family protein [Acidobacteriia bacterium]|nr:E3 ubiquitin ligase family protein [Terriglobia bacterium]